MVLKIVQFHGILNKVVLFILCFGHGTMLIKWQINFSNMAFLKVSQFYHVLPLLYHGTIVVLSGVIA